MQTQVNTDLCYMACYLPWDVMAKLRTKIKGMKMPPVEFKGRNTRKKDRPMCPSYFIRLAVAKAVEGTDADDEEAAWAKAAKKKREAERERQDALVRSGVNRKPPSQWKRARKRPGAEGAASPAPEG